MAGNFESLYENIHQLFNDYNKSDESGIRRDVVLKMSSLFLQKSATYEEAQDLTSFVLSILPTYGQLVELGRQDKIDRYKRIRTKINSRPRNNLLMDIIEDTLKDPSDNTIGFTLPVHSSFCYIIKDYSRINNEIYVNSINLYPQFATTESGPERTLGVVLKRPVV